MPTLGHDASCWPAAAEEAAALPMCVCPMWRTLWQTRFNSKYATDSPIKIVKARHATADDSSLIEAFYASQHSQHMRHVTYSHCGLDTITVRRTPLPLKTSSLKASVARVLSARLFAWLMTKVDASAASKWIFDQLLPLYESYALPDLMACVAEALKRS